MVTFTELLIPAFFAGFITFLAPCTFPLVPGFIAFISGGSGGVNNSSNENTNERRFVYLKNAVAYVCGFSIIFILLGISFAFVGSFFSEQRMLLSRIGGVFIMFLGFVLLGGYNLPGFRWLARTERLPVLKQLQPGTVWSSFVFGVIFALGWTPCIGPILGTILFVASMTDAALQGAALLAVFSLGLGFPFLLIAASMEKAQRFVRKVMPIVPWLSYAGGVFLLFLGTLMLLEKMSVWTAFVFRVFSFIHYDALLRFM